MTIWRSGILWPYRKSLSEFSPSGVKEKRENYLSLFMGQLAKYTVLTSNTYQILHKKMFFSRSKCKSNQTSEGSTEKSCLLNFTLHLHISLQTTFTIKVGIEALIWFYGFLINN